MVISGGGTGGHLFPAIAIAQRVKELSPNSEVLFVGAKGKIEMDKVPQYGFDIKGLWISGFYRGQMLRNLNLPFKLISSLLKSFGIVRKFKPQIAVGVGGYASGALLFAAGRKGVPTLLQEQNSYPGVTNKLLASKAKKICVAFPGMEKYFEKNKLVETGNPIRSNIKKLSKESAAEQLGFAPKKPVILVIGGSLGARTINNAIEKNLDLLINSGVQMLWQCGKIYLDGLKERIGNKLPPQIQLTDFINDMDVAYGSADLVISRAGALSISELTFLNKPSVLVPSPNVAEDHQTKNAQVLAENGAAELIEDAKAEVALIPRSLELVKENDKLAQMSHKAAELAKPNAADEIAKQIFELVK
ncbi:MAG: undecaprenyldiphospho-muramoylpentapeptide beta-N-acetylglucosaminyltransferase [Bacteroidia bacterium]